MCLNGTVGTNAIGGCLAMNRYPFSAGIGETRQHGPCIRVLRVRICLVHPSRNKKP